MTCRKEIKCKTFYSLVFIACCILYNVAEFQKVNPAQVSVPEEPGVTGQSRAGSYVQRQAVLRHEEATGAGTSRLHFQGTATSSSGLKEHCTQMMLCTTLNINLVQASMHVVV